MDKLKLIDKFIFDLDVGYGSDFSKGMIFVSSFSDADYKKIKSKARELGLKFRKRNGELIITIN
jgi:hypothetical protein